MRKTSVLLDTDFKTSVLNMLKELKKNMNKELHEIRKTIYEQKKNINKEIEVIKEKPNQNSGAKK